MKQRSGAAPLPVHVGSSCSGSTLAMAGGSARERLRGAPGGAWERLQQAVSATHLV